MGVATTIAVAAVAAGSLAYSGYQLANQPKPPKPGELPEDPSIAAEKETEKKLDEERRLAGGRGRASTFLSDPTLGVGTDIFGSVPSNQRLLGV